MTHWNTLQGRQILPTCKRPNVRSWVVNTVALKITHYYPPPELSANDKRKSEYMLYVRKQKGEPTCKMSTTGPCFSVIFPVKTMPNHLPSEFSGTNHSQVVSPPWQTLESKFTELIICVFGEKTQSRVSCFSEEFSCYFKPICSLRNIHQKWTSYSPLIFLIFFL